MIESISKDITFLFVDDTDLAVVGENSVSQMQMILNLCNKLHSATGGKTQVEKTKFFAWTWTWSQGKKKIKNVDANIQLNNQPMQQLNAMEEEKTLGVFVSPSMRWLSQCAAIEEKLKIAMWRLRQTPITIGNAYVFYNVYLITHVYFGCGIVNLLPQQEKRLMKISESVLLKKLGLGEKFPRDILHMRKSSLGVGLMKPSTTLAFLALQLYLGHARIEDDTAKMTQAIQDNEGLQHGHSMPIMDAQDQCKLNTTTWCDEIASVIQKRGISIINNNNNKAFQTSNKSIMQCAIDYVESCDLDKETLPPINHMRLCKQMHLPCELIGMQGNCKTKEFREMKEKSSFKWKY